MAKELPHLQSEAQLQSHVDDLYKKAQVKPGEVPAVDDIAKNRINMFYTANK
jgi:hypothetical protein